MTWMKPYDKYKYLITYCKYSTNLPLEERRMKPTNIWTNHPNPKFKLPCKNGDNCHVKSPRGSKTGTQGMKNAKERSTYPQQLVDHIVEISECYMHEENLFDKCKCCKNKWSSMECDMCENFDMYIEE